MPTLHEILRERTWKNFINMKYKGYVVNLLYSKYQRWDRTINVFLAFVSCGSIATWAVWKEYPMFWAALIAISQVVNAVKPLFPYNKYVKEFGEKSLQLDSLNIDFERLFNQLQTDTISDLEADEKYYAIQKEFNNLLRFSDDVIFDVTKQKNLNKEAEDFNKIYFRTHFNVELN